MKFKYIALLSIIFLILLNVGYVRGDDIPNPDGKFPSGNNTTLDTSLENQISINNAQGKNIQLVNQIGGATHAVALIDQYSFIGTGGTLSIFDISDPSLPYIVGKSLPLQGIIESIEIIEQLAVVTTRYAGLSLIDISNKENPQEIGYIDINGYNHNCFVVGDLVYIASQGSGLHIVDISDPSNPVEVGMYYILNAIDVAVLGRYAYVTDMVQDLIILDVSSPNTPIRISSVDLPGDSFGIAVSQNRAYITGLFHDFNIVDISNPSYPILVSNLDQISSAIEIKVAGDFVYIADGFGGLRIIDISEPNNPSELAQVDSPGYARDVAINGENVLLADDYFGFRLINVNNVYEPLDYNISFPFLGSVNSVTFLDSRAFVTDQAYGNYLINFSDPSCPQLEKEFSNSGMGEGVVKIHNNYAFVNGEDLIVMNIEDPLNPAEISRIHHPGSIIVDFEITDQYVYFTTNSKRLVIIDISNIEHPTEISNSELTEITLRLFVLDDLLYLTTRQDGLKIFNILDKNQPVEIGSYAVDRDLWDVYVSDNRAYVVGSSNTNFVMDVLDVTNPSQPFLINSYLLQSQPYSIKVDANLAYIGDSFSGVRILNINDAYNIEEIGYYDTAGGTREITRVEDRLFVSDLSGGLYILNFTQPTTQGIDLWINSSPEIGSESGGVVNIPISYGNLGLSPSSGYTIIATIPEQVKYERDTSGIEPISTVDTITWNFPGISFLPAGNQFNLYIKLPEAQPGSYFPISISIESNDIDYNLENNSFDLNLIVGNLYYFPNLSKTGIECNNLMFSH